MYPISSPGKVPLSCSLILHNIAYSTALTEAEQEPDFKTRATRERLHSENTLRHPMITHTIYSYLIPFISSQNQYTPTNFVGRGYNFIAQGYNYKSMNLTKPRIYVNGYITTFASNMKVLA